MDNNSIEQIMKKTMENMPFSPELLAMYQNYMSAAAATMISAFEDATRAAVPSNVNKSLNSPVTPSSLGLDTDIPRKEIECDPEIVVVKTTKDVLKKSETNLNGLHGKKFGFREVIEMSSARTAYPVSPSVNLIKRNRTSVDDSVYERPAFTQVSEEKENQMKKIRITGELTPSASEDSNDSVCKPPTLKNVPVMSKNTVNLEQKVKVKEPEVTLEDKMCHLRLERMRVIQKKKPKFNVENIELTYHSNMARNFPGSEFRTQDQQARRDKNTLAARISRTKNKAYEKMLEDQSQTVTMENFDLKRKIACMRVYAAELMKLVGYPERNLGEMWEENLQTILRAPAADDQASTSSTPI